VQITCALIGLAIATAINYIATGGSHPKIGSCQLPYIFIYCFTSSEGNLIAIGFDYFFLFDETLHLFKPAWT